MSFDSDSYAIRRPFREEFKMGSDTRAAITRALAAVPDEEVLGVLSFPVSPESCTDCLVCKLVNPEYGDHSGLQEINFAEKYGVSRGDAASLYYGANSHTAEVEEMIAERLDDIVFGKSVGQAA